MKITKFILPIVMCGLLASCGSNNNPVSIPTGGSEATYTDNVAAEQYLNSLGDKISKALGTSADNGIGAKLSLGDITINAKSESQGLEFSLNGLSTVVESKIAGYKTAKSFSDLKSFAQVSFSGAKMQTKALDKSTEYTVSEGSVKAYLDQGTLYTDITEANLTDNLSAIQGLLTQFLPSQASTFILALGALKTLGRFSFNITNLIPSTFNVSSISLALAKVQTDIATLGTTIMQGVSDEKISNLHVYTYEDGSHAIEANVNADETFENGTFKGNFSVNMLIDKNNLITDVGVVVDANGTVTDQTDLSFKVNGNLTLTLNYNVTVDNVLSGLDKSNYIAFTVPSL